MNKKTSDGAGNFNEEGIRKKSFSSYFRNMDIILMAKNQSND